MVTSILMYAAAACSTAFVSEYVGGQLELLKLVQEVTRQEKDRERVYGEFAEQQLGMPLPADFLPLVRADAGLAAARARLARFLNDTAMAKRELLTVLAYREFWIEVHNGLRCDGEELEAAHAALRAEVLADLAELEGDRQAFVKHLGTLIAHHRKLLERADQLLRLRVIGDEAMRASSRTTIRELGARLNKGR